MFIQIIQERVKLELDKIMKKKAIDSNVYLEKSDNQPFLEKPSTQRQVQSRNPKSNHC